MFPDRVYKSIQDNSFGYFGQLTIEDIRIGALLTAVKLSDGY